MVCCRKMFTCTNHKVTFILIFLHVCRLKKSLCNLRQAPRAWFSRLVEKLQQYGFLGSKANSSLYLLHWDNLQLFILIHVDDIIVIGSNTKEIDNLISMLDHDFLVNDLGNPSYFLGVGALRDDKYLLLTQRKYIVDLLTKVKLQHVKSRLTPMSTSSHLSKFE